MGQLTKEQTLAFCDPIQGWMGEDELAWLHEQAGMVQAGGTWVEVGTWKGRSFSAVALGLPANCTLVSVDTFGGSENELDGAHAEACGSGATILSQFEEVLARLKEIRPDVCFEVIVGDSVESAVKFSDQSTDAVFIDGCHAEGSCKADIEAWLPKLKKGGLLCGHDKNFDTVQKALRETIGEWKAAPGVSEIWYTEVR